MGKKLIKIDNFNVNALEEIKGKKELADEKQRITELEEAKKVVVEEIPEPQINEIEVVSEEVIQEVEFEELKQEIQLNISEKREKLIDWINQMDEKGIDELIKEYLS